MPRSGRDLSLTTAVALAAACVAAAAGVMTALGDLAVSIVLGGLLFVTLVSIWRWPNADIPTPGIRRRSQRP